MLFQQENTITGLSDPLVNKKRLVVSLKLGILF